MSVYPLYESTFSLYRVSPLYHGSASLFSNLTLHSRRLRSQLSGDVFRNIVVAADSSFAGGPLKACEWSLLGDEPSWARHHRDVDDSDEISVVDDVATSDARGILIRLEYEKARYTAILLSPERSRRSAAGFTSLPLLLVKMPVALKDIVMKYITTAFDARISQLKLRSSYLAFILEVGLSDLREQTGSQPDDLSKGCQLQLTFPSAAPELRSIEIAITSDDLQLFLDSGQNLWRICERNQATDESSYRPESCVKGPFTAALSAHLEASMTVSLDSPGVLISKFAYGPFAFAGDGKVKILRPSDAAHTIWNMLLKEAEAGSIMDKIPLDPPSAAVQGQKGTPAAHMDLAQVERLPTEPPPPYELHDPSRT